MLFEWLCSPARNSCTFIDAFHGMVFPFPSDKSILLLQLQKIFRFNYSKDHVWKFQSHYIKCLELEENYMTCFKVFGREILKVKYSKKKSAKFSGEKWTSPGHCMIYGKKSTSTMVFSPFGALWRTICDLTVFISFVPRLTSLVWGRFFVFTHRSVFHIWINL